MFSKLYLNSFFKTGHYPDDVFAHGFLDHFDYAVFDEIHTLNYDFGDIYESIIKITQCNCLALSATFSNVEYFKSIIEKWIHKKIHYIEYNERFINHEKWLWNNNKLIKIHPLSCIDYLDNNI